MPQLDELLAGFALYKPDGTRPAMESANAEYYKEFLATLSIELGEEKEEKPASYPGRYLKADKLLKEKVSEGYCVKVVCASRQKSFSKDPKDAALKYMAEHKATELIIFGKSGERAVQVNI